MLAHRSGLATVTAFGDDGWGTLVPRRRGDGSDAEPETVSFHSTAIVDGSRTVQVGTQVRYRLVAGRQGCWEATDVEPVTAL